MKISPQAANTNRQELHEMQERWKKEEKIQQVKNIQDFAEYLADCIDEAFDEDNNDEE